MENKWKHPVLAELEETEESGHSWAILEGSALALCHSPGSTSPTTVTGSSQAGCLSPGVYGEQWLVRLICIGSKWCQTPVPSLGHVQRPQEQGHTVWRSRTDDSTVTSYHRQVAPWHFSPATSSLSPWQQVEFRHCHHPKEDSETMLPLLLLSPPEEDKTAHPCGEWCRGTPYRKV